ncbi:MAG: TIGR04211 family SH3 domain-containing protein [Gammaproteobacteria bacterium]|nr:TIGR04211 family SH3 domain-containing protein [Gammaproteobacteria bacterium]
MVHSLILGLVVLFSTPSLLAATRYVTDQFEVTLRGGEGTSYKIQKMLKSGAQLELISENRDSGYSFVRTENGREGYVLTRQLQEMPAARDRLQVVEGRLQQLLAKPSELRQKLTLLEEENGSLKEQNGVLTQERDQLSQKYEILYQNSESVLKISGERDQLQQEVAELSQNLEDLNQLNQKLEERTMQRWFLIGGGVLFGGILLGLLLPHLRLKRSSRGWDTL